MFFYMPPLPRTTHTHTHIHTYTRARKHLAGFDLYRWGTEAGTISHYTYHTDRYLSSAENRWDRCWYRAAVLQQMHNGLLNQRTTTHCFVLC